MRTAKQVERLGWSLWIVLLAIGCSGADRAPELRLDRVACARCGMLISELSGAAAYRTPSAGVRAYDDLACLVADRVDGVGRDIAPEEIWVYARDSANAGEVPVRASTATFVRSPALRTPMGGGVVAFVEAAVASAFAAVSGGELLLWDDLTREQEIAAIR